MDKKKLPEADICDKFIRPAMERAGWDGAIANADVVRIAGVDTLKASKLLAGWRDQGLLVALPGRAKRNMAYTKPSTSDPAIPLLSSLGDNNQEETKKSF